MTPTYQLIDNAEEKRDQNLAIAEDENVAPEKRAVHAILAVYYDRQIESLTSRFAL